MLSDKDIQNILENAMENYFSRSRPDTVNFFDRNTPNPEQQPFTVSIHKWAFAPIMDTDTFRTIKSLAKVVVREVAGASLALTSELVFRVPGLLPYPPIWDDGAPLFASHAQDGEDRLGVPGGNIIDSVGHTADDISIAVDRLVELDPAGAYDSEERLKIYCAAPQERKLMKACARAGVKCRVIGIRGHHTERGWIVSRAESPCSMLMTSPTFLLQIKGNQLLAGAKFDVWIENPRLAVYVTPKET